jgi:hypothetical protein
LVVGLAQTCRGAGHRTGRASIVPERRTTPPFGMARLRLAIDARPAGRVSHVGLTFAVFCADREPDFTGSVRDSGRAKTRQY